MKKIVLFVITTMLFAGVVYAHSPYMEEGDFSFDAPFVIAPAQDGGPPAVMRSMAVFAFLDNNDFDVYQFTLTPGDFYKPVLDEFGRPIFENGQMVMQFSPVIISASALPPACQEYKNFYPKTALLGFGLPAPVAELPFDVPMGYGVVVADNPHVEQRETLTEVGISWYLPEGLTQYCLYNAPYLCDYTNTISQAVFAPDTYYLVVYDDTGRFGDYTANIGFLEMGEEQTPEQEAIIELMQSGAGYRLPCIEP